MSGAAVTARHGAGALLAGYLFMAAVAAAPVRAEEVPTEAATLSAPVTEGASADGEDTAKPARNHTPLVGASVPPTSELASRGSKAFLYGLTAFFIGIAFYKKFGERTVAKLGRNDAIAIIAKKQLTPKHQLFLVNVRGKELLLGAGAEGITAIAELEASTDSPFNRELAFALNETERAQLPGTLCAKHSGEEVPAERNGTAVFRTPPPKARSAG